MKRLSGCLLVVVGLLSSVVGLVILTHIGHLDWGAACAATAIGALFSGGGAIAITRGRGLLSPTAAERLANDRREPVLMLRAFADDGQVRPEVGGVNTRPGQSRTFEEGVEEVLDE